MLSSWYFFACFASPSSVSGAIHSTEKGGFQARFSPLPASRWGFQARLRCLNLGPNWHLIVSAKLLSEQNDPSCRSSHTQLHRVWIPIGVLPERRVRHTAANVSIVLDDDKVIDRCIGQCLLNTISQRIVFPRPLYFGGKLTALVIPAAPAPLFVVTN